MPSIPLIRKFFGNTVSSAAGYAAGGAVARTLHPELQSVANEGWSLHPDRPVDVGTLASGVAQGQVPYDWAAVEAKRTGFNKTRFDHMVDVESIGPGSAAAFELWRRGVIGETAFRRALKRNGLEQEWIDDLVKLKLSVLDSADLARAIHRGLIPDPGLLQGELPAREGHVPAYPVYPINALAEALADGFDKDHLGVLVGLQGNPMGAHEAAEALFRGVLTEDDYLRAIAEGNTRNEWAQAILDQTRQIPTARDFFENALRGYHELPWALEQAKRHGMSPEDALVIYQNQGRPMNLHQITTALARGGAFQPEEGEIQDPYRAAIVEGNLKPAYYDLDMANRYSYPSPMYFRLLQTTGVLNPEEAKQRYLEIGWPPDLAEQVSQALGRQKATAAKEATATDLLTLYDGDRATEAETLTALHELGYPDDEARRKVDLASARRAASARNTAITGLHKKYEKNDLTEVDALTALATLGVPEWARTAIVAHWTVEKNAGGATPTVGSVKADYRSGKLSRTDAIQTLETLGLTAQAAAVELDT